MQTDKKKHQDDDDERNTSFVVSKIENENNIIAH